jgi:hypothetical protein
MSKAATHLPTFKQLRYFVALAEQKHFGRAAAQCFVSQSAFSIAIRELETTLDANLVDRTNRSVTITPVGLYQPPGKFRARPGAPPILDISAL